MIQHRVSCPKLKQEILMSSNQPCQCLTMSDWAHDLNEAAIQLDLQLGRAFMGRSNRHPFGIATYLTDEIEGLL